MVSEEKIDKFKEAARIIKSAKYLVVFTGAGISAESGVPTFRGDNGIWKKYDSNVLTLSYFIEHPEESWKAQKEFFDIILNANPNYAHIALAELEKKGILKSIVTQNIDNLHQKAGSENVFEFHGTMKTVTCINPRCMHKYKTEELDLTNLPPKCEKCGSVLKTDICFFEENPPEPAKSLSFQEASKTDVMIIVGTSGVVHPAALLPVTAKENGAKIIEINPDSSLLTIYGTTDIFLQGEAGEVMKKDYGGNGVNSSMQNYKITLLKGDITKVKADAIVNAANSGMLEGGGVDGAIRYAAGKSLLEECIKLRKEKIPDGLKTGEAIQTKAYNLPAKIIIHTVGPKYYSEDISLLKNCYINCLKLAEENNCESIAFPAISTGAYGCPIEKSAKIVKEVLSNYIARSLKEVILVLYSQKDYDVYNKEFA